MSARHPIIAVTGSSGAGTTSVSKTFEQIFRRERLKAAFVEGDSFHRYDRAGMREQLAEALARGDQRFSHFGPQANLFAELEELFRGYAKSGEGKARKYLHDDAEAAPYGQKSGTFTDWADLP
ncbi:MAG: phosphoribulokinase, partial [Steroidobacteraceae bacterium]